MTEIISTIIQDNIDIVNSIQEIYRMAPSNKLRQLIEKHFIPTENEKKQNAEISTPIKLVDEMLNKIPLDFWKTPKKVFEPCCGKGNFVLGIFDRFYNGLKELYPKKQERCKIIITECLYYADITHLNVFITTELIKCHAMKYGNRKECKYKGNSNVGNSLELNIDEKWKIKGFDAVIGNPPYNNELWAKFVEYSIQNIIEEGYLLYVHLCNWRKPNHIVGKTMKKYDISYLKIFDIKSTFKLFNCNVRVDWYLLQKTSSNIKTQIVDDMNTNYYINIKDKHFIPNNLINIINKVSNIDKPKLNIIRNHKIISNSKKLKEKKTETFKYSVLTNLNSKGKKIKYTDNPIKNIYDKHKVLMSYSLHLYPFYDNELSSTEHIFYQIVNNKEEGYKLVKYLNSKLMKVILQSLKWIGYQTDHKIFEYLPNIIYDFNDLNDLNDDNIYQYFNLITEEIKLIESLI